MRGLYFLAILAPALVVAQPKYMIQDLGLLPNQGACWGTAISANGTAAGFCSAAGGSIFNGTPTRVFVYANGTLTDLGHGSKPSPVTTGVNDSGTVVGAYTVISLQTGVAVSPFIGKNGSLQQFTGAPPDLVPFGLTNDGRTSGTEITVGDSNFFVSSRADAIAADGTVTHLAPAKGTQATGFGISSDGSWVAGTSATVAGSQVEAVQPTIWHQNTAQLQPLLSGFDSALANAVNSSGVGAGMAFTFNFNALIDPHATGHAVMFNNNTITDLGTLPGDAASAAVGINNSGVIVGFSSNTPPDISLSDAVYLEAASSNFHAFVYMSGTMYDLTRTLVNGSGWKLAYATAINDNGLIVGTGIINQQQHAFLLTPVQGPQVNSVVGAGLSVPAVSALSGNGLFTLFGSAFADASVNRNVGGSDLVNNALPTNLANTCVQAGDKRWGLIYVSAAQINAVADPLTTSGTVPISVISNCDQPNAITSTPVNVNLAEETPQFLFDVQDPSGKNEVVAVNAITGAKVGPVGLIPGVTFAPAKAGDILTVYAVGLGPTKPAAVVGSLAAGAADITGEYSLTVGGVNADVSYAGLTPTYSGLYQINFTVPSGLMPGNQPIVFKVNGTPTPDGAYLAVQ